LSFEGEIVLLFFEVVVDLLNLSIKLLLLIPQLIKLFLLFEVLVDSVFEVAEGLPISHFLHQIRIMLDKRFFVFLDEILVVFDFGVVLQLPT